ncbi:hypothetical protein Lser_V15G22734 [Lactuca serriola]
MEEFKHLRVPLDFIKHATNNFGASNFIAEGGFGKVYKGEFKAEFFQSGGPITGAVKLLDRSKDQADVSFWREIMLLSSYSHKNLISLLGFCDESDQRIIVYEYASNKSLDFHIFGPDLTWIQRLKICVGAACGLQYLHDPRGTQQRVLHRDIKSANILLDENWNAKIADFGLSKYGPANQQHTFLFSDAKGTLGYCDPMYIETMLLTKESDVYSFGVVLFEVLCSRPCVDYRFNDQRRSLTILAKKCYLEQTLHTIIDVNIRQQIEQNSLDTFVRLAYQCLEKERTRRPSMDLVVSKLKTALKYQVEFEVKEPETENRVQKNGDDYEIICPPGRHSVILYTGYDQSIPQSFYDCSRILALLDDYGVSYEERNVLSSKLKEIFRKNVLPPRLFINGKYVGGAEEINVLDEQGKLEELLFGIT